MLMGLFFFWTAQVALLWMCFVISCQSVHVEISSIKSNKQNQHGNELYDTNLKSCFSAFCFSGELKIWIEIWKRKMSILTWLSKHLTMTGLLTTWWLQSLWKKRSQVSYFHRGTFPPKVKAVLRFPKILLMDKILHHLGCIKPCK